MLEIGLSPLTPEDVEAVARGSPAHLAAAARDRIARARGAVEAMVAAGRPLYGVSTGVGTLCSVAISAADAQALQRNIVRSHAAGVGAALPDPAVRAIMFLLAAALARGHSGVRPVVVETLLAMLAHGVHPVIPEQGSLGASGDLAPLAHLALVLMGEGEATYRDARLPGAEAMARAGLMPIVLEAKEGVALINGTHLTAGLGCLFLLEAERLAALADVAGALTLEALRGTDRAFHPILQRVRPHPGQVASAEHLRRLLAGSGRVARDAYPRIQDAYSLRCMPQVHGATRTALAHLREVLTVEINSVTDNPLVFPDEDEVISGGNFHGQPLALALDYATMATAELASIGERRIERLVNPAHSGLPPFLVEGAGLQSGYMVAQYTAAALVSENKVLCHPASVDSIPTSANQEDHVSMGAAAARKALLVLRNSQQVLGVELVLSAQAIDFGEGALGRGTAAAYWAVRSTIPTLTADRVVADDLNAGVELVRSGAVLAAVAAALESA